MRATFAFENLAHGYDWPWQMFRDLPLRFKELLVGVRETKGIVVEIEIWNDPSCMQQYLRFKWPSIHGQEQLTVEREHLMRDSDDFYKLLAVRIEMTAC